MIPCRDCGFDLEPQRNVVPPPGYCLRCGSEVCLACGCTDEKACERADGTTCSWEVFVIDELPEIQPGRYGLRPAPLESRHVQFLFSEVGRRGLPPGDRSRRR